MDGLRFVGGRLVTDTFFRRWEYVSLEVAVNLSSDGGGIFDVESRGQARTTTRFAC